MLGEHARSTQEAFAKQTAQLNQVLANNSAMMQQTANQVGAQSKEAVGVLTSQTQTLREVSRGLLYEIHGLTQRFENQGQAILTAAKALDFLQHEDRNPRSSRAAIRPSSRSCTRSTPRRRISTA